MKRRTLWFILGGLGVALILAGVVSNFASPHPDGLDSSLREGCTVNEAGEITGGTCPAQAEKEHEVGGPLADYGEGTIGTGAAGVLGVLITFALAGGLFWLVRRRRPAGSDDDADEPSSVSTADGR